MFSCQSLDFVGSQVEYVPTNETCRDCGSTIYRRLGGDEANSDKRCVECFRSA
jgi:hypothetical protein